MISLTLREKKAPSAGVVALTDPSKIVWIGAETWKSSVPRAQGPFLGRNPRHWALPAIGRRRSHPDLRWDREPDVIHVGSE